MRDHAGGHGSRAQVSGVVKELLVGIGINIRKMGGFPGDI